MKIPEKIMHGGYGDKRFSGKILSGLTRGPCNPN